MLLLGDGKLQIEELVNSWETLTQHSFNGEELMEAFKTFDKKNTGFIRIRDLKVKSTDLIIVLIYEIQHTIYNIS